MARLLLNQAGYSRPKRSHQAFVLGLGLAIETLCYLLEALSVDFADGALRDNNPRLGSAQSTSSSAATRTAASIRAATTNLRTDQ